MKSLCQNELMLNFSGLQKIAPWFKPRVDRRTCRQNLLFIFFPILHSSDGPKLRSSVAVKVLFWTCEIVWRIILGQNAWVEMSLLSHENLNEYQNCSMSGTLNLQGLLVILHLHVLFFQIYCSKWIYEKWFQYV